MCHHMSKIFKGFLSTVRNSFRISKVLKGVVCWHLFLGCRKIHSEEFSAQKIVFYNFLVFKNIKFLTCSEIKTPKSNPLTKVSGLISDINKIKLYPIY